jgi:hypothetical protein
MTKLTDEAVLFGTCLIKLNNIESACYLDKGKECFRVNLKDGRTFQLDKESTEAFLAYFKPNPVGEFIDNLFTQLSKVFLGK